MDYFDIFYTHRYDGFTPLEETAQALIDMVRAGKTLYVGISKYPPAQAKKMYELLRKASVPCLISQYRYSMFERTPEQENITLAANQGSGFIAFSPLAQGLLTDRYLHGIPANSRATRETFLKTAQITPEKLEIIHLLNNLAVQRGQTLAQMALAWVLRDERVTSVIIGTSSVHQLTNNLQTIDNLHFTSEELELIDRILDRLKS